MRVLWAVNLIPANAAKQLRLPSDVLGGWVESMAKQLRAFPELQLAIACKTEQETDFQETIDGVCYYSLCYRKKTRLEDLQARCEQILREFQPELIQIEGTEFLHAKAMLLAGKAAGIKAVLSMQGILNGQYAYQCGQLPMDELLFCRSATKMFAAWILHLRKTRWYKPRMKPEREILSQAEYFLGRTTWDRAHTYEWNKEASYFSCDRILRDPFYQTRWKLETAERHSIYVGNAYYALKGAHFVVRALPELIREYPDIKVYIAGHAPFAANDKRAFFKKGYGAYLKKLIDELQVGDHIVFTGPLQAEQVAHTLAHVHAYVLCSTAENSPNTLGEAMLVGTPCVSSYVGGAPDMATDGVEALFYRSDDPALLAWQLKRIFDDDNLARSLSEQAQKRAAVTHDKQRNARQLLTVYQQILSEERKKER